MSGVISVFSLSSPAACSLTNQQGPDFGLQGKDRCGYLANVDIPGTGRASG